MLEQRVLPAGNPTVLSIDRTAPATDPTNASALTYTVKFSESVTGVDVSDFRLVVNNGSAQTYPLAVTGSGSVYTVAITEITDNGRLRLNLVDDNSIRDAEGNTVDLPSTGFFEGQQTVVDYTRPTAQGHVPAADRISGLDDSIDLEVVYRDIYGEGIDPATFDVSNITVDHGARVTGISVNGDVVTYTIASPGTDWQSSFHGTYTIGLTSDVKDLGGNSVEANSAFSSFLVALHVQSLESSAPSPQVTTGTSLTYTATFSENVTGVTADDFRLQLDGVNVSAPLVVSGSGTTYTIQVAGLSGSGTLQLTLVDNQSIRDAAGNPLVTFLQTSDALVSGTAYGPQFLLAGDWNNDGQMDLAVTSVFYLQYVMIFLGEGDGTFGTAQVINVGERPEWLATGDFDGDHHSDLALVEMYDDKLLILRGNAEGEFRPTERYGTGGYPDSVAASDVNRDGRVDLVVAGDTTLSVFLGNGDGKFSAPLNFDVEGRMRAVTAADLNGDGKPDLAVVNYVGKAVSIVLGNGDGTFGPVHTFATQADPRSLAISDMNSDGRPDLLIANRDSDSISELLGNGDGTFAAARNFDAGHSPNSVSVLDLNGDARNDVAVASKGGVTVLRGNGDGSFAPAQTFTSNDLSPDYASLAVADFNGDGQSDIAISDGEKKKIGVFEGISGYQGQTSTIDLTPPTAEWVGVPFPTTITNVDSVKIQFSESVTPVTLHDFTFNATDMSTIAGLTLSSTGENAFTISGLAPYTSQMGTTFTVAIASGNTLHDVAGYALSGTPSASWNRGLPPHVLVSTPASNQTTSVGGATSFTLVLDRPNGDAFAVDLSIVGSPQGVLSASRITFNGRNWNVPQTVTVTGTYVPGSAGGVPYAVHFAPSINGTAYSELAPTDLALTNDATLYRVYSLINTDYQVHFYTTNKGERDALLSLTNFHPYVHHPWQDTEVQNTGFALYSRPSDANLKYVQRLYNSQTSEHYYTVDIDEARSLAAMTREQPPGSGTFVPGWMWENEGQSQDVVSGNAFEGYLVAPVNMSDTSGNSPVGPAGTLPVFRLYQQMANPVAGTGDHTLTNDPSLYHVLGARDRWVEHAMLGFAVAIPPLQLVTASAAQALSPLRATAPASIPVATSPSPQHPLDAYWSSLSDDLVTGDLRDIG